MTMIDGYAYVVSQTHGSKTAVLYAMYAMFGLLDSLLAAIKESTDHLVHVLKGYSAMNLLDFLCDNASFLHHI